MVFSLNILCFHITVVLRKQTVFLLLRLSLWLLVFTRSTVANLDLLC